MFRKCFFALAVLFINLAVIKGEVRPGTVRGDGAAATQFARVGVFPDVISWEPNFDYKEIRLRVSGEGGFMVEKLFKAGESIVFDLSDGIVDGTYSYEVVITPNLSDEQRTDLREAEEDGTYLLLLSQMRDSGFLPPDKQSGYFTILQGAAIDPGSPEPLISGGAYSYSEVDAGSDPLDATPLDQVILDDLIVDGSICVGQDCVNGESFGFDTIRLKENNLRIKFQDTSNSASFPTNDWQITVNDSSNGGANKFSIDDIDGGRTPFTIEASAPSNSLYVDDGGRLGLGTSIPVVDAHVVSGNTPTLRLEQDGSSGFTPQTWDVAGNEANFFVRDATNGSTLPFRIFPGAPSNAIAVKAGDGNVGLGMTSPTAPLHLQKSDGKARIHVEEKNTTALARTMFELTNNGGPRFAMNDTDSGRSWEFTALAKFNINYKGRAGQEFQVDTLGNGIFLGNVTANGVTYSSDREKKTDLSPLDGSEVLGKVAQLPLSTWRFKSEGDSIRHAGPTAQDFHAAFGLGGDEKHIYASDISGVALAAIQGLNKRQVEQMVEIAELKEQLREKVALLDAQQEQTRRMEAELSELSKLRKEVTRLDALEAQLARLSFLLAKSSNEERTFGE